MRHENDAAGFTEPELQEILRRAAQKSHEAAEAPDAEGVVFSRGDVLAAAAELPGVAPDHVDTAIAEVIARRLESRSFREKSLWRVTIEKGPQRFELSHGGSGRTLVLGLLFGLGSVTFGVCVDTWLISAAGCAYLALVIGGLFVRTTIEFDATVPKTGISLFFGKRRFWTRTLPGVPSAMDPRQLGSGDRHRDHFLEFSVPGKGTERVMIGHPVAIQAWVLEEFRAWAGMIDGAAT
jgi:hypothetical protein